MRLITAGAGTGKTTELTRIIREGIVGGTFRPQAIIGTTFTNKAADELIERVRQTLFASGRIDLAERVGESLLGTVDSVCARLLQRFAFEAGISPKIAIISEKDSEILLNQAIEEVCSMEQIREVLAISDRLGQWDPEARKYNWPEWIGKVASKARENVIAASELPAMGQQGAEQLLAFFPKPTSSAAELEEALIGAITSTSSQIRANADNTEVTRKYRIQIEAALKGLNGSRLPWSDWVKLVNDRPSQQLAPLAAPVAQAAACYTAHPRLHDDIRKFTQIIFSVAAATLDLYQSRKEERGLLDYTDLEQRTLELLNRQDVADVIHEEFDLLIVDEFQDTNPIQLALFMRLAELVRCDTVWVGDVKQAIYGFRGSDPALMGAVVEYVKDQSGLRDTLSKTYRASPELVKILNALFVPAFKNTLGLETSEVELSPDRQVDPQLGLALEFWDTFCATTNLAGIARKLTNLEYSRAVSEAVVGLFSPAIDCKVFDKETRQVRHIRPRDVAVLCRTNNRAAELAEALSERGLPLTLGAAGLLGTPEARLAMACLRRMADPGDTLATAEIIALDGLKTPEEWLGNRLEYLTAQPPDSDGHRWGIEPPLIHPSVVALHDANKRLKQLTPSEALDEALWAGNVFVTVSAWGSSEARAARRRANLEALRGMALQYEAACGNTHNPATVAGFVFWCDEQRQLERDTQAADEHADAIHISTYHGAKGLEWPVVICADLEYEPKNRLWDLSVVQESPFDPAAPLANRRLRFWPWPFGALKANIPLADSIAASPEGQKARQAGEQEELRLLYVGFTRARDLLVPVVRRGEQQHLLDLLKAPWFRPLSGATDVLEGAIGPSQTTSLQCRTRTFHPPQEITTPTPTAAYRWFPSTTARTLKRPAFITASAQAQLASATVGECITIGSRVEIGGDVEDADLGDALHGIFAADLLNPGCPGRLNMIERTILNFGLEGRLQAVDLFGAVDRFSAKIQERFSPKTILVEVPFYVRDEGGQALSGFIDLVLETAAGWIIIDHKSFQGSTVAQRNKALSFSGQINAYRKAVVATGRPVQSMWIHFPVGGTMLEILA